MGAKELGELFNKVPQKQICGKIKGISDEELRGIVRYNYRYMSAIWLKSLLHTPQFWECPQGRRIFLYAKKNFKNFEGDQHSLVCRALEEYLDIRGKK